MDISVGDVVRGFMVGCTKAYNTLLQKPVNGKPLKPLWGKGYHDRILWHAGQLQNMINYVKDNPRRLMVMVPDAHSSRKISREECVALNALAGEMAVQQCD